MAKEFMKAREFAEALKVSPATVYAWIDAGKIEKWTDPEMAGEYGTFRIPSREVTRVKANLSKGLPIGYGVKRTAISEAV